MRRNDLKLSFRLATLVGAMVALSTVLNGLGAYLRRTGLWEPVAYAAYWERHCVGGSTTDAPVGLGRRCIVPDLMEPPRIPHALGAEHVFRVTRGEHWLKVAKDATVLSLVGVGVLLAVRADAIPIALSSVGWSLAALVAWAGARIAVSGDLYSLAAGLRAFSFLAVAATGRLFASPTTLAILSTWMGGLLWLELLLVPGELLFGLPLNGYLPFLHLPSRVAGTLTKPNSLGAVAVVAFIFANQFSGRPRVRWPLLFACVTLVLASGSATGMLVLLAWVGFTGFRRLSARLRAGMLLGWLLITLLIAANLTTLLGRPSIYKGLAGRWHELQFTAATLNWAELFVGQGLGRGTNTLASLRSDASLGAGDSTITSLLRQTGIAGITAFYLLLAWAWRRDSVVRPFVEVIALVSVTTSVIELFPVNLLLGLTLARCSDLTMPGPSSPLANSGPQGDSQ